MAAVWLKRVKQLDRLPGTIRLRIYQRNKYTATGMYMYFIPASQLSLPTIRLEQGLRGEYWYSSTAAHYNVATHLTALFIWIPAVSDNHIIVLVIMSMQ